MRRGFAIQFNWIFVLLVGAVLFGFFMVLTGKQKEFADSQASISLSNALDTIVKTRGTDSVTALSLPKTLIEITCDQQTSILRTGKLSQDMRFHILFGPSMINEQKVYVWNSPWNSPMPIASATAIVEPGIEIIVRDDSARNGQTMARNIPDQFTPTLLPGGSSISPKGQGRHRIITLVPWRPGEQLPQKISLNLNAFNKVPVMHIEVLGDPPALRSGIIRFHSGVLGQSDSSYFFGESMVKGAIASQDIAQYRCNLNKALLLWGGALELKKKHLEILQEQYPQTHICRPLYGTCAPQPTGSCRTVIDMLSQVNSLLQAGSANNNPENNPATMAALKNIDRLLGELERANNNVDLGPPGCPYIY